MANISANTIRIQRGSEIPPGKINSFLFRVDKVEKLTWPKEIQATIEKFKSRLDIFPEGFVTISLPEVGIVGVSTSEIIDYDPTIPINSWEAITDNGWIKNTHTPSGNALYVVSLGVSPQFSNMGIGTLLLKEQVIFTQFKALKYLIVGARIPGYSTYHKIHHSTLIQQYIYLKRDDGLPVDPEIRFYTKNGLRVIKTISNYMKNDSESENYGAVMIWENVNK